jgi:hypothetical protein
MNLISRTRVISIIAGVLALTATAAALKGAAVADSLTAANTALYLELVQRLENGDFSVDITDVRMAYAGSSLYSPYTIVEEEHCYQGIDSLQAGDATVALGCFYEAMRNNYLFPKAHWGAELALHQLGLHDLARFHTIVIAGILDSIREGGDGQSCNSAYVVIGNWEEYFLIYYTGHEPLGQAVIGSKDCLCDEVRIRNMETDVEDTLHFNINIPIDWDLSRKCEADLKRKNELFQNDVKNANN